MFFWDGKLELFMVVYPVAVCDSLLNIIEVYFMLFLPVDLDLYDLMMRLTGNPDEIPVICTPLKLPYWNKESCCPLSKVFRMKFSFASLDDSFGFPVVLMNWTDELWMSALEIIIFWLSKKFLTGAGLNFCLEAVIPEVIEFEWDVCWKFLKGLLIVGERMFWLEDD